MSRTAEQNADLKQVLQSVVTPGQRIGNTKSKDWRRGTVVRNNNVYSTLVGRRQRDGSVSEAMQEHQSIVPRVDDRVQCIVRKCEQIVLKANVFVDIVKVNEGDLLAPFYGQLRLQDVRHYDVDRIKILECFRPGFFFFR